jgi:energy-coupling factor transporter ATP-binding protein EcfA2
MPAIWTFGPDNTTGIDLSANAFWRLVLGATGGGNRPLWLTLALIYPPAPGQTILNTQITLARSPISVTDKTDDVLRLAEVSVSMGSLEKDRERMTEAFNLFKNNPRVRQDVLDGDLKGALEILDAYWSVRDWLFVGAAESKQLAVGSYVLSLRA